MKLADFPEIAALPVEEKLSFVSQLWDSIEADGLPPLTEAELDELDRRMADPAPSRTWEQVRATCEARLKDRDA